eukprot:749263-Alexandrium_andersonii.AAC.1
MDTSGYCSFLRLPAALPPPGPLAVPAVGGATAPGEWGSGNCCLCSSFPESCCLWRCARGCGRRGG